MALIMIVGNFLRYMADPTFMVRFDRIESTTPFPAVVLCPEIKFSDEKISNFLDEIKIPPSLQKHHLQKIMKQLAAFYSPDVHYNVTDLEQLEYLLEFNAMDVETAAERMTSTCAETLLKCHWDKQELNCSDIFHMELTGDGFCCVFNARSLRRELKHGKYMKNRKHWVNKRFGYSSGLMLAVNQSQKPQDIDLTYKWVAILNNQHFVDSTVNGTPLNPGTEQWLAYYKMNFQIDDSARALSAGLRRCNMATETSTLNYFPIYAKKYCRLECELAKTFGHCNCLRLVHPFIRGKSYCQARKLACSVHSMVSFTGHECPCPVTCDFDHDYVNSYSFNLEATVKSLDPFYHDLDYKKVSVVRIYVQKRLKDSRRRWSYYSYLYLFSQVGGMLNVFIGSSVLTFLTFLQIILRALVTAWQKTVLLYS